MYQSPYRFESFPVIKTDRLILNALSLEDSYEMFLLRSDEEVMRYIPRPKLKSEEEVRTFLKQGLEIEKEGNQYTWAIRLKEKKELLGTIGFYRIQWNNKRGEVGFALRREFHRNQYMSEALKAILEWGYLSFHFHSIEAVIDPNNQASENLLLKHGFVKEGHLRENFFFEDHFYDSVIYGLLKSEWLSKKN